MAMILTVAPALEPVSLSQAKAHLRVDHDDEDALISSLVTAARVHIETGAGAAFITQQWRLVIDAWPVDGAVRLPLAPLQSIDEVLVRDADGVGEVLDAADYFVDAASNPPRLVAERGAGWPRPLQVASGIEILFTAGFGPAAGDVPQPLLQAVLLLVAHWYETREPVSPDGSDGVIPLTVNALVAPYRRARL
jgi:uncharacterized phiE125 gp8 family phage protein